MRPAYLPSYSLALALLLPPVSAGAAPPKPNFANMPAYLTALNQSQDPEAASIRRRIADGPADLVRERAAAEKAGLLIHASQLQQPLPPADQNAAPLYVQLDALRKQRPFLTPLYAQPLNGRYAYTPTQIAAVQNEVDARQDVFNLLHQATDKPQCVFADAPAGPLGLPTLFTHYAGLRESAREINTESLLLAYQGKYPQAVANQKRGFCIAAQAASGGGLISLLVGEAVDAITLNGVQSILSLAGPNAALDSHAEADILALPPLSLRHALNGEAAMDDAEFSRLRHATPAEVTRDFPDGSRFFGANSPLASTRFTSAEQAQMDNLVDAAQADYLHQLRQLIAAADAPSAERNAVFGQEEARASANHYDPIEALSDLLNPAAVFDTLATSAPNTSGLEQQADRVTARRLVTAAGAVVLAEKAKTGAFPSASPPQFIDPFNGQPLGYQLEGTGGFVVYSAGPTGTFTGGKPGDPFGPNILFRYPLVLVPVPTDMLK